ncbi:MAG: YbhB/YbcL family Raf kinase inhibitor-like protein [Azospirillaceae bacterium]
MTMTLTSTAFGDGERIPVRHTCDGRDVSPSMAWSGVPKNAKSLVLICDDPDAPRNTFAHWAVFDMPPDKAGLEEGYGNGKPSDARQALNDFGNEGWGGPCPPVDHGVHHYSFRLLALGTPNLDLPADADCRQVEEAAMPHVLAEAELTGLYER